jgi:hypothetical protein
MSLDRLFEEIEMKMEEVEIPALKGKLFNGDDKPIEADRMTIQMTVFGITGTVKSEGGAKLELNRSDGELLLYDKDGKLSNSYSVAKNETKQAIEDFILNAMIY